MSKGFIDFGNEYWCAFCGRKVPKGEERYDSLGRAVDWKCGHLLRYKVRNKNQCARVSTEKLIEPFAITFSKPV